ncbi:hypothetical protein K449DRAFT_401730 [Hypoxylon sp. EC38]|nr:hypothetical protein K449DRAFT_401730 [Hypoxylon sp. EC38]
MRPMMLLIIAALCCLVSADWARSSSSDGNTTAVMTTRTLTSFMATRTVTLKLPQSTLWLKPTPMVGQNVIERRLRRGVTEWTDTKTCGWIAGVSSESFVCDEGATCATNTDNIVACVSGTVSPFYSVCLNHEAFQSSLCADEDMKTGCCFNTQYPECATYLWTNSPQRSMYRCWTSSAIITMLDVPQFVADATLTTVSAEATATSSNGNTLTPARVLPNNDDSTAFQSGLSVGAIVGIVIGSVSGLAILFGLVRCYRHRRKVGEEARQKFEDRLDRGFQNQRFIDPAIVGRRYPDGRVLIPRHSNPRIDLQRQQHREIPPPPRPTHYATTRRYQPAGPPIGMTRALHSRLSGRPALSDIASASSSIYDDEMSIPLEDLSPGSIADYSSYGSLRTMDMPPPRYSVMNPYPDATPGSFASPDSERFEADSDADYVTVSDDATITSPGTTQNF